MPDPPRRRPAAASAASRSLGLSVGRSGRALPIARAHFRVFIDGREVGVRSVSPLHWADPDASDPDAAQRVVLRRAASTDRTFFDWRQAVAAGRPDVRTVTVAALEGPGGRPVAIWRLEGATATRWSGPSLDAMSDEIACEELEVRYESVAWRSRV